MGNAFEQMYPEFKKKPPVPFEETELGKKVHEYEKLLDEAREAHATRRALLGEKEDNEESEPSPPHST